MSTGYIHIPLHCPQCRADEPNEITDHSDTAYQCRACGHVWDLSQVTVTTKKWGTRLVADESAFTGSRSIPDVDRIIGALLTQVADTHAYYMYLHGHVPPVPDPPSPRMPGPTPYERGILDRYQPKRRK